MAGRTIQSARFISQRIEIDEKGQPPCLLQPAPATFWGDLRLRSLCFSVRDTIRSKAAAWCGGVDRCGWLRFVAALAREGMRLLRSQVRGREKLSPAACPRPCGLEVAHAGRRRGALPRPDHEAIDLDMSARDLPPMETVGGEAMTSRADLGQPLRLQAKGGC
jgi:hypothetical protein